MNLAEIITHKANDSFGQDICYICCLQLSKVMWMNHQPFKKKIFLIPAIGETLLYIRYIKTDLSKTLSMPNQNQETTCKLSSISLRELDQWEQFIVKNNGLLMQKIVQKTPKVITHVDAPNTGWGISSPLVTTSEF